MALLHELELVHSTLRPATLPSLPRSIDRTKGIRPGNFKSFEGTSVAAHEAFGELFNVRLVRCLDGAVTRGGAASE